MKKPEIDEPKRTGRVAFWARKESIEKMLEDKHSITAVFLAHRKEVKIGYGQFRRYVNEFIRRKDGDNDRASEKGKDIKKAAPIRREPGQPAFVSSDTPRDKDSLIGGKK